MSNCCLQGQVQLGEGGSSFHSGIEFGRSGTGKGSSGWRKKGVVWRSRPGAARTILLFYITRTILRLNIMSARASKPPLMVNLRTFIKVCGAWLLFLFLQEQIKDIIINGIPLLILSLWNSTPDTLSRAGVWWPPGVWSRPSQPVDGRARNG